jgi:hypothetical protein
VKFLGFLSFDIVTKKYRCVYEDSGVDLHYLLIVVVGVAQGRKAC